MLKVLIVGGGTTGFELAKLLLTHDVHVNILEANKQTCEEISDQLSAQIFCGDAKIPHVLESAGIGTTDVIIAVTESEATNVLVGSLAKIYNIKRILVRVRDPAYIEACEKLGINEIIDPATLTAQYILAHLRGLELVEIIEKIINSADVISFDVTKDSKYHNKHLNEIPIPNGNHLFVIIRGNTVIIPEQTTKLHENDKLIFMHKKSLKESISKFFGAD